MAYDAILAGEIDVGDPVTASLMGKVRGNLIDHQSRISNLEGAVATVQVFSDVVRNPPVCATLTGFFYFQARSDFTLTTAQLSIGVVGSLTGSIELDIKKSPDLNPANFASVLTTLPSVDYDTASDYDVSTNAVYDNTAKNVLAGEWLRFDFTEMPTGAAVKFVGILVYGEV